MSATAEQRVFVRWTRTCDRCGHTVAGESDTGHGAAVDCERDGWVRIAYEHLPGLESTLPRPTLLDPEEHVRQRRWMWSERDLCPTCADVFRTFVATAPA